MLKILLISQDEMDQKRLTLLARSRGCQVDVLEPSEIQRVALVRVRPYTMILVTSELPWEFHIELSTSLWDIHPDGYYAVYTFSSKPIPAAGRLESLGIRVLGEDSIEEDFLRLIDEALPSISIDTSGIIIVDPIETPLRILESMLNGIHFKCFTTESGEQ